ncbi:Negative regulator of mitotic exit [Mortierella sp. 14UC]|nr:Negative regulator of mitotic exit [Mortierella sp. 14UC]
MSTNPFPRFSHTASFVNTGNDIYIFGGIVKGSVQKDVHVIDAQSLHCQMLPVGGDAPNAANGHTAVTLGQYIMYFGGKDAKGKTSDTLYVFHTGRKEWNKPSIQSLQPAPRHSHAACVIGTVMYVTGGQLSGFYMNDINAFDLKTLNGKHPVWTMIEPKSSMPPARAGHCAAAYDGKVYIFGGADDKYYYNDIWCFDPERKRWEAVPAYGNLPTSRQGHTCCVIDDVMYIYGGMNHEDQLLGDLCAFKFSERRWITIPVMEAASARTEHAMCNVGDRIYIFGGQLDLNANEDPGLIHVLDTAKIRWSDPSGSQRSAYDNESTAARTDLGMDDRSTSSYSRPSPSHTTTDSQQRAGANGGGGHNGHEQGSYSGDSRRGYQQQQPQHHIERSESYMSQQQQQQQGHQQNQNQQQRYQHQQDQVYSQSEMNGSRSRLTPASAADDSQIGQRSPSQLSIDFNEATTHVARRRTIGKPVGYVVPPETEGRGTLSIDEVRRPGNNDGLDLEVSRASPVQIRRASVHQAVHGAGGVGGGGDFEDRNGIRHQKSSASIHGQFSHLDLSRQGSPNASSETLNRQGSYASLNASNNNTQQQSNGRSTDSRSPLRVVNSDQESDTVVRSYHKSGSNGSTSSNELQDLKQREQWLMAEVSMARKKIGDRPLSMAIMALEDELENCEVDSEKYRIMQALLNVKAELERSKTTIVTQAQVASNKVREAERVRTSALQEAAYLKAKVAALESGEMQALVQTETARAGDLEKRLASALAQLDKYEAQFVQYETILEHEKQARETAEEREREASSRAEDAQTAHTRALNEMTHLLERASVAEASLRETVAKSATSEAGLSSYQQQSTALISQIVTLKTTMEHQKKSLEKVKMAYSVANERAEHADKMWTQSRKDMDLVQLEMSSVRADVDRALRESEHWKSKASETEMLWQKAKKENETMRVLLEDDMNSSAAFSPTSKDRKHDSIMAITSASRLAELEHELTTLRGLLKESQDALTVANRDLGDTMVRLSQLEQTSMSARAEAAVSQRQLIEARSKVTLLQAQLIRREEAVEEMVKEQERNEVQLGLLRGVMRENGLEADDIILDALSKGSDSGESNNFGGGGGGAVLPLKQKVQEAEKRAIEAERQVEELQKVKTGLEARIQQLEADYQTAVHYVQGTESTLQRLRDEAQGAQVEKEALRASLKELGAKQGGSRANGGGGGGEEVAELEEEISDLHRRLHASHERGVELEKQVQLLSNQVVGASQGQGQQQLEVVERALADTKRRLDLSREELEQAHELNKVTGQELEDALDALKKSKPSAGGNNGALETSMENAQRTILGLQRTNKELEEQLRASENKISLLLDNFQAAPESVRNSVASLSALMTGSGLGGAGGVGGEDYLRLVMEGSGHGHGHGQYRSMSGSGSGSGSGSYGMSMSPPLSGRSHMTSPTSSSSAMMSESLRSPTGSSFQSRMNGMGGMNARTGGTAAGGGSSSGRSASAMSNSQKLEEYEKMIDEMTNARRQYEE